MKLERLTERIWIWPYEEERDRPNLGYIRGDRWSLAVDAGHSDHHIQGFYSALKAAGLPLPRLTVLTHWHWDHTFGMHAAHGLCLAGEQTNRHLAAFRSQIEKNGPESFLSMDDSIRREYKDGKPVIITLADLVFRNKMKMDAGNCPILVFHAEAPHTDDSTLVEVPGEKVLFLGDADCRSFPDRIMDPVLAGKLAETVRKKNPEICVPGHWTPLSPDVVIQDLLEGNG